MASGRGGIPVVAIVGRPNVGKSTLFNRFLGQRSAIVEDRARTTRDRLYGDTEWNGRRFVIVDTGVLLLLVAGWAVCRERYVDDEVPGLVAGSTPPAGPGVLVEVAGEEPPVTMPPGRR